MELEEQLSDLVLFAGYHISHELNLLALVASAYPDRFQDLVNNARTEAKIPFTLKCNIDLKPYNPNAQYYLTFGVKKTTTDFSTKILDNISYYVAHRRKPIGLYEIDLNVGEYVCLRTTQVGSGSTKIYDVNYAFTTVLPEIGG